MQLHAPKGKPVLTNALSLYGSTLVTSVLGFAFWWAASHGYSQSDIGDAAGVLSALQLIGLACVLGLNTLVIGEVAADRASARSIVITAAAVAALFSFILSVCASVVMGAVSDEYASILGPIDATLTFAAGCTLTCISLIADGASIGLLRGGLQLGRNGIFAVVKLCLVPLITFLFPHRGGFGLLVAWSSGIAASLLFILWKERFRPTRSMIDLALVRRHWARALSHHWLNVALQASRLAIPTLAIGVVGPRPTAEFYAVWLIVSFVTIIPSHLATVLFAVAPGNYAKLRSEARITIRVSLGVAVASAVVFGFGAEFILHVFNSQYSSARGAMMLLGFSALPIAVKSHYVAINRVRDRLREAATLATMGALIEIACSLLLGSKYGTSGLAAGFLFAIVVESLFFAPSLVWLMRQGSDPIKMSPVQ